MVNTSSNHANNGKNKAPIIEPMKEPKENHESQERLTDQVMSNKRSRKRYGYMISAPQRKARTQTPPSEPVHAQPASTQVLQQPPPVEGQKKLTRKEVKARGACFYCKEDGHHIRQCPKKSLHKPLKKAAKQDLADLEVMNSMLLEDGSFKPEYLPVREYDEEGRLTMIKF